MKEVEFTPYAMLLFIHLQFQHDIIHDLHILAGLGKERTDIVAGNIGYNIMEESFLIPSGGGNDISKHKYNLKGGAPPMPYNFDEFLKEFFIIDMEKIMTYEKIESGKVEGVVQRDFEARAAAAAAVEEANKATYKNEKAADKAAEAADKANKAAPLPYGSIL